MNESQPERGGERPSRAFHTALTDLADTMPDDPMLLDAVRTKVRHLRVRRQVLRTGVVVSAVGATVVGLLALRSSTVEVSSAPAASPTTAASSLPSCTALLAPGGGASSSGTGPVTAKPGAPTGAPKTASPDEAAKQAAAEAAKQAAAGAKAAGSPSTDVMLKAVGKVVRVSADAITISVSQPPPNGPDQLTATFEPSTVYADSGKTVTARPTIAVGDQVVFGAQQSNGGPYKLVSLEVNPPTTDDGATGSRAAAGSAVAGSAADTEVMKGVAEVVSSASGTLTLRFTDGPLAGKTLTASTGSQTTFTVGDEPCAPASVPVGSRVGAVVVNNDAGSYTIQRVTLVHAG